MNRPAGISNIVALDPVDEIPCDDALLVDEVVVPAVSLSDGVLSQAETKPSSRIAQTCDPTE